MNLLQYLYNRKVRKLAERIIATQTVYHQDEIKEERIVSAITTAHKFYEIWDEIVKEN